MKQWERHDKVEQREYAGTTAYWQQNAEPYFVKGEPRLGLGNSCDNTTSTTPVNPAGPFLNLFIFGQNLTPLAVMQSCLQTGRIQSLAGLAYTREGSAYTPGGLAFTPEGLAFTPGKLAYTLDGLAYTLAGLAYTREGSAYTPGGLAYIQAAQNPMHPMNKKRAACWNKPKQSWTTWNWPINKRNWIFWALVPIYDTCMLLSQTYLRACHGSACHGSTYSVNVLNILSRFLKSFHGYILYIIYIYWTFVEQRAVHQTIAGRIAPRLKDYLHSKQAKQNVLKNNRWIGAPLHGHVLVLPVPWEASHSLTTF